MFTNLYQEILRAISRWFEIARLPAEPELVPVKVRIDEAEHNDCSGISSLTAGVQTMSEPMKRIGEPVHGEFQFIGRLR